MTSTAAQVVAAAIGMDLPDYAERYLRIRTKTEGVQPFRMNPGQLYLHRRAEHQLETRGFVRLSLLKARQFGGSTYVQARYYSRIARGGRGQRAFILTHSADATRNIFGMTHRFHLYLDPRLRPTAALSQQRIAFPRFDSSYAVATAGTEAVGRSDTIQLFHGSEVAYWDNAEDHVAGALQAVPAQGLGTEIVLESTGKGFGNAFALNFANARAGLSDFEAVFVPWFWFDEYRAPVRELNLSAEDEEYAEAWGLDETQMQFRQNKVVEFGGGEAGRIKFMQEYPATPEEGFATNVKGGYIESRWVLRARRQQWWAIKRLGPRVLGIDPAYTGNDRFVCWMRQGRVAWRVGRWTRATTGQSLPRVIAVIDKEKPDIIAIDIGGPGAAGIYEGVLELCAKRKIVVIPVQGGEQADDTEQYRNRRTQNWARMREWFESPAAPCILDRVASYTEDQERGLEEIQGDITSGLTDWDNKGRPVIETKKKLLTHSPSPDNGDALANTFDLAVGPGWQRTDEEEVKHARRPINWRAS